jgi:hypothetical protein
MAGRDEIINGFLGGVVGKLFEAGSHVFEFRTIMAEGDTVVLEWRVQARNAAGEAYDNLYAGFFVVHDGKITTVREYLDSRYAAKLLFPELDWTATTVTPDRASAAESSPVRWGRYHNCPGRTTAEILRDQ